VIFLYFITTLAWITRSHSVGKRNSALEKQSIYVELELQNILDTRPMDAQAQPYKKSVFRLYSI